MGNSSSRQRKIFLKLPNSEKVNIYKRDINKVQNIRELYYLISSEWEYINSPVINGVVSCQKDNLEEYMVKA